MSEVKFRKSWASISITAMALSTLTILPALFIFWDILFWGTDKQFAMYDSWWTMIFFEALLLSGIIYFCWEFTKILTVKFTDEGAWQRGVLGWKFISWKKVTYVESIPFAINLYEHKKKMTLNLALFANLDEVVSFIQERISSKQLR